MKQTSTRGVRACPRCGAHVEHNCAAKACPVGVMGTQEGQQ